VLKLKQTKYEIHMFERLTRSFDSQANFITTSTVLLASTNSRVLFEYHVLSGTYQYWYINTQIYVVYSYLENDFLHDEFTVIENA